MSMPSIPFHRYRTEAGFTTGGAQALIGAGQFSPAYFILEGLDLTNNPLVENSAARVTIQGTGPEAFQVDVFRGFVYASSQGSFSWRGACVIFPNETLDAISDLGAWSVIAWGHVEPAYSLSP